MTEPLIVAYQDHQPIVDQDAFLAPGCSVVGRVRIGARASVWFGSVLRGDGDQIEVGEESNIQDGCVVHADPGVPCRIGPRVTVGHRAVVHGATVGEGALIGMGAILLNGATIGAGSMVAAGSVILEGAVVPPGALVAGVPARVRRDLTADEQQRLLESARTYVGLARAHRS